ncbi:KAP family P-loop NTPase fold protein [Lentzea flava]|uniref:KAP family P-loop NTPase fold protein n=1 Tax=Lentzea flava TaxID=103732 RepID=UPI00166F8401|nr:P-loop NTPase fold protein [Lentzea flava]MCP2197047.1 KAP family P-loop domain-containing protein [Lentzea flava]
MAESDRAVNVLVLAGSDLEFDAVRQQLDHVQTGTSDRPLTAVGTIRGTTVEVALGLGLSEEVLVAIADLRPKAILVARLGEALSYEVAVDDVVVATRLDHYLGQDSQVFGNEVMTWLPDSTLQARAFGLARAGWRGANPEAPCDLHFGPVAVVRDATTLTRPVTFDFRDAVVIDSARPALDAPTLDIYGVTGHANIGVDVSSTTGPSSALSNLVAFALALAVQLDADAEDVVRRLRTRGHGDRVARTDLLAREAFVESLAELLAYAAPADSDEDLAGPTVIAIEGAWGAGKSTLMDMTRARLDAIGPPSRRRRPWSDVLKRWRRRKLRAWDADLTLSGWFARSKPRKDVAAPRVLTAMFNPWSYQTGEHVWAGLNECIVSTGAPVIAGHAGSSLQRFWFTHNIERLDRRHVQRTLRKRLISPLLRLGVFALPVPLLAQLLKSPDPYTVIGYQVAPVDLALWITGVLLGAGLLHTAVRYVARAADTLLPAELFGPLTGYTAGAGTDDPLRDPHRRARTGPLHSAQQDVQELIRELGDSGSQLVVFIDDLDRCSPRTTADVFEAINGFLSASFPTIRFVLGIDAAATAAHLDAAYSALVVADAGRDTADPSPGWTFLRKLIQLPLPLPRVVRTHVEPLLTGLLGTQITATENNITEATAATPTVRQPVIEVSDVPVTGEIETAAAVVTLEHDERVRARFAERLQAQPDLSVREAKRILTVWMFYVRVLDRLRPETGVDGVSRACHLVLLAEIVARWPAAQRCLHRRVDGRHGLRALTDAVNDNALWEIEVRRYGLSGDQHQSFRTGLRRILREYDGSEIAALAEQLT